MKISKSILLLFLSITIISCNSGVSKQPATAEGFANIEKEIKSKFGMDAYYTKLDIVYNESIGNMLGVIVTDNPASLKMAEWGLSSGNWSQNSEITIEIPKNSEAKDFMFQINEKINLKKLGGLVEQSIKKLKAEKNIDEPTLDMAFVKFPKNGDASKAEYCVMLKPKNGGTLFTFFYKLTGELIKMNY